MLEVVSLLVVLVMSLIITRVATVALALTGMTQQSARFQARSALTGAGFTTTESERVVNHPVRRRVIMALMLMGNTGLVLVAALLVALLGGQSDGEGPLQGRGTQLGLVLVECALGLYEFALLHLLAHLFDDLARLGLNDGGDIGDPSIPDGDIHGPLSIGQAGTGDLEVKHPRLLVF